MFSEKDKGFEQQNHSQHLSNNEASGSILPVHEEIDTTNSIEGIGPHLKLMALCLQIQQL